ncbi:thioredoxin [Bacillus chungangensis]|uniref:Thioredoxin n=1 Tax=Bacillus chungangensis TaxID=587633 RepID=A0ABT9WYZ5_9BACI|nr:thioredoxin [Bacillus chungangensis]MDQ0178469.1 thioredoxin 1 [Bacillus chungangensis]
MLEITNKEQFNEVVQSGVVLVDFFAPWCGPCKILTPILNDIAKEYPDAPLVRVSIEKLSNITDEYEVETIPTLLIFDDGKVVKSSKGLRSKEIIVKMLNEVLVTKVKEV